MLNQLSDRSCFSLFSAFLFLFFMLINFISFGDIISINSATWIVLIYVLFTFYSAKMNLRHTRNMNWSFYIKILPVTSYFDVRFQHRIPSFVFPPINYFFLFSDNKLSAYHVRLVYRIHMQYLIYKKEIVVLSFTIEHRFLVYLISHIIRLLCLGIMILYNTATLYKSYW